MACEAYGIDVPGILDRSQILILKIKAKQTRVGEFRCQYFQINADFFLLGKLRRWIFGELFPRIPH